MTGSAFCTVAPVSAVCAAFAAQPSTYPLRATKPDVAPTCGKNSTEAQRSGFGRKRRCSGMDETCRLRRGEGYGACIDEAARQEKSLALFCASPSTSARSAGSFGR